MTTKRLALVALVGLTLLATSSGAVDYFPSESGPTFSYQGGAEVTISAGFNGSFVRQSITAPYAASSEGFAVVGNGDVVQTGFGFSSFGAPDGEMHTFDPPLTYLDFPLDTGKSWSSTSYQSGTYAQDDSVTVYVAVIGPTSVSVPAGEFQVIEVSLYYHYHTDNTQDHQRTLWLNQQLGPVNGLVGWTGVVGSERSNWGSVKALFR